jgi:hypothetical protein
MNIPYHHNAEFELNETEVICHCEHCESHSVPPFKLRRWFSESDAIELPGLDGPLVTKRDCNMA